MTALKDLWLKLDKREAPWAAEVKAPAKTQLVPQALDYDTIITTLNYMEPSLAKACGLIMAWCGFRPVEIRRTEKWMVKLTGDVPQVIRKTAKGGLLAAMPLTAEAILGWEMFDAHGGWEAALANINRDWKAAMQRAGFTPVKIYSLVHSFWHSAIRIVGGTCSWSRRRVVMRTFAGPLKSTRRLWPTLAQQGR